MAKLTIVFSLLMAVALICVMVFMSSENMQYSIPVSSFHPNGDIFCRLDGVVTVIDGGMAICESGHCISMQVPLGQTLEPGQNVMVEGRYHDGILEVSRILRRCEHAKGTSE